MCINLDEHHMTRCPMTDERMESLWMKSWLSFTSKEIHPNLQIMAEDADSEYKII